MADKAKLDKFEEDLAKDLKKDGYDGVMEASMSVRNWRDEGLSEPPTCPVCGMMLDNQYLAFRQITDTSTWVRLCLNRVWCRVMATDPPDVEGLHTGGAWFRRVADLYRNVTF